MTQIITAVCSFVYDKYSHILLTNRDNYLEVLAFDFTAVTDKQANSEYSVIFTD